MTNVDNPDPPLNDVNLLANDAPASDGFSCCDPAYGKVRLTLEENEAFSVTTVRPDGRIVTFVSLAVALVPGWNGNSGNSKLGESNAAEKLRLLLTQARGESIAKFLDFVLLRCCTAVATRPMFLHAMVKYYKLLMRTRDREVSM